MNIVYVLFIIIGKYISFLNNTLIVFLNLLCFTKFWETFRVTR